MSPSQDTASLSALQAALGARTSPDGRILTFGDVPAEYRAGMEGVALFDLTARGRVVVSGADAVEFLHRLLANRVRAFETGQGAPNLLLNSKGKVLFGFDLYQTGEGLILDTEPGQAGALLQALDMYLFADKVTLTDQTPSSAPLALVGPGAAQLVRKLFSAGLAPGIRRAMIGAFEGHELSLSLGSQAGSEALLLDAGPSAAAALFSKLHAAGATPAGQVAADCLRVEAGQAAHGIDVDQNVYPQEARLERAFALDKGCYIGQEVVAKIDTYGGINKRLCLLAIDHDDPLPRGTRLVGADPERGGTRELGLITSWAYSFVLDRGLVLAYLKRRQQAVGTRMELADSEGHPVSGSAEVVAMPVRTGGLPVTGDFE